MNKATEKSNLSRLEVSLLMDQAILKGCKSIAEEGFMYPMMILFSKKEMSGTFENPYVLKIFHRVFDEELDDFPYIGYDGDPIHRTYVILSSKNEESEKSRHLVAKELVNRFNPDALAFLGPIFYRITNSNPEVSIDVDPEALTALHVLYYLKGDPSVRIKNLPYIDRGRKEKSPLFEEEKERDLFIVNSGWAKLSKFYSPHIKNPYK